MYSLLNSINSVVNNICKNLIYLLNLGCIRSHEPICSITHRIAQTPGVYANLHQTESMPLAFVDLKNLLFVLPRSSIYINLCVITILASDESTLDLPKFLDSVIPLLSFVSRFQFVVPATQLCHYNLYSDESSLDQQI